MPCAVTPALPAPFFPFRLAGNCRRPDPQEEGAAVMLIVNADDLGRSTEATDSALACFAAQRISSATAMVFMKDSQRAAEGARKTGLAVGLHLNLSEAFTANDVSRALRQEHDAVRRFLTRNRYALVLFNPRLTKQFNSVVKAQLAEFERLFGHAPSHIDGHQHMHLATNVLAQRLLPRGAKVRRGFSFRAGEKNVANLGYRRCVDWLLKRRHTVVDHFFPLPHDAGAERFDRIVRLARGADVEVMTHPERPREFAFLMTDNYLKAVSSVRFGGYDRLEK